MRPTLSLIRREFNAYFLSPIAYVVLAVFLAVTGHLFYLSLDLLTASGPKGISYPMELMVNSVPFWLVFVAIAPLLTMRLFAEEQSTGTLEMLMTAPVREWQVVFAKFTACYAFYTLMWLPTLAYLPVLTNSSLQAVNIDLEQHHILGGYIAVGVVAAVALCVTLVCSLSHLLNLRIIASGVWLLAALLVAGFVVGAVWPIFELEKWYIVTWQIDPWPILTTYIGLALAGAMFLSIGLLISSLVNSQMIAALIALFLGMIFVVGAVWRPEMDTSDLPYRILNYFTVPWHFERNFGRGLIDTRNLVLYASVALLGLFLTVRSLESRRWR